MTIDTYKGHSEKELRGKLAELSAENFKAGFTSERVTSQKGAEMNKRRKEIARIKSVLASREALKRHAEEQKKLELRLSGMGQPHQGSVEDKRRRSMVSRRLGEVKRAIRELDSFKVAK